MIGTPPHPSFLKSRTDLKKSGSYRRNAQNSIRKQSNIIATIFLCPDLSRVKQESSSQQGLARFAPGGRARAARIRSVVKESLRVLPRRKVSINPRSSRDIGADPKETDIVCRDKIRLTNVVRPFSRNPLEIEVTDWRQIYLENEKLLPPLIIPIRNSFDNTTTSSRSENHHTRKAVASLSGE